MRRAEQGGKGHEYAVSVGVVEIDPSHATLPLGNRIDAVRIAAEISAENPDHSHKGNYGGAGNFKQFLRPLSSRRARLASSDAEVRSFWGLRTNACYVGNPVSYPSRACADSYRREP